MYKFKFADIGEGLHEGLVAEVYVKVGDEVKEGDSLFSVETDKVTSDIPSPVAGKIATIKLSEGETIHVGDEVFHIDDGTGAAAEETPAKEEVQEEEKAEGAASVVGDIKVSNKLFSFDMFSKGNKPTDKANAKKEEDITAPANSGSFDINSIEAKGTGDKVDVVVIGGGPAGYKAAASLGKAGLNVVNVEQEAFGGTCVNIGCIPVKSLIKATKVYKTLQHSHEYGFEFDKKSIKVNVTEIFKKRFEVSKQLAAGAESVVKTAKAKAIKGTAEIIDKHNVKVGDKVYTTKVIIIATGAKPRVITLPGFDKGYKDGIVIDTTQALSLKALPKTLTVVGGTDDGGPSIDVNFAQILSDLGVKVTLIKPTASVITDFDGAMQKMALDSLKEAGVEVILNATAKELKGKELTYTVDGKDIKVTSDAILAATGRDIKDNTFEKHGIDKDERGFVKVNANFQTSIPNIFAIGDVVGYYMLAHEGFKHGMVSSGFITGKSISYKQELMPKTSYVDPEIAMVGFTEEQLKEKGIAYIKGEWLQAYEGKSVADGETKGLAKILIGKTHGEILGAHISSTTAIDSISEISAFMELEGTIEEMANLTHTHPAVNESIWDASLVAYDAFKKVNKK